MTIMLQLQKKIKFIFNQFCKWILANSKMCFIHKINMKKRKEKDFEM